MIDFSAWFRSSPKLPPYWKAYEMEFQKGIDWKKPIDEVEFVVFDTETTGLDASKDHIITISALIVKGQEILLDEAFECILKRESTGNAESIPIHQLLPQDLHEGFSEIEAIASWVKFIGARPLVAHHIGFDLAMLHRLIKGYYPTNLKNIPLDTALLALRLERFQSHSSGVNMQEYGLDELCMRYQIPTFDRHTASGDTFITAQLLLKLLHQAKKRGIKTLESLAKSSL